jgi:hypothetical protein
MKSEFQHFIHYIDNQITENIELIAQYPRDKDALLNVIKGWKAAKSSMLESHAATCLIKSSEDRRY